MGLNILLLVTNFWVLILILISIASSAYIFYHFRKIYLFSPKSYYTDGPAPREFCESVASEHGVGSLEVRKAKSSYSDRYDVNNDVLFLRAPEQKTVRSLAVAAHEMGHVIQSLEYGFIYRFQSRLKPLADLFSILSLPLILAGLLFYYPLTGLGVFLYFIAAIIILSALPFELDASRRGKEALEERSILDEGKFDRAEEIFRAASLTYVAAVTASVVKLISSILVPGGVLNEEN